MSSIKLNAVEKWFGATQVIKGVDLEIEDGEFVISVGPSGCGKSTLLRMIAGLEETSRGQIMIADRDATAEPPSKRGLAMVFQSYALYPHMSVRDNVGFPLKSAGLPKAEVDAKVNEAAHVLKLNDYLDRRPDVIQDHGGRNHHVMIPDADHIDRRSKFCSRVRQDSNDQCSPELDGTEVLTRRKVSDRRIANVRFRANECD